MTTTLTRPRTDEAQSARREEARATMRLVAGVAVSIAGIALLVAVLVAYGSFGDHPSSQQNAGTLLVAAGSFAISAWGTDVRHRAVATRKAIRKKLARAE